MSLVWLLVPFSIFTSVVAAIMGIGGGLMLIAVMPFVLPAAAVVPVHSIAQMASNASRAGFAWRAVQWRFLFPFVVGSIAGVAVFTLIWTLLPERWLPLIIGSYILLTLWNEPFSAMLRRAETFYSAGFLQTGLGIVVGATGPLTLTLLSKQLSSRDQIVATSAMMMLVTHILKTAAFVVAGFVYTPYLWLMVALIIAAIVGSWLGTVIRRKVEDKVFQRFLKGILSVLAVAMITKSLMG
ncbi:sulfite exporter TauE/SafE family protein [Aestuariibacter salexigens]|uniref:sulfite exporter TauE/SafE family protein n=1 Tax=Aestuariibacter salexigens TaxID=226010 RepID=UPI0003FE00FD|nr:sulfite exporter TauE/SafE family protein [Aestuariibacter salexigens]